MIGSTSCVSVLISLYLHERRNNDVTLSLPHFNARLLLPHVNAAQRIDNNDDDDFKPKINVGPSMRERFNFVADVVQTVEQSVVNVEIQQKIHGRHRPVRSSNGSGFIVRENGLILTNAHVVSGRPGKTIVVTFPDGSKLQGVLEDLDTDSDLAIIKCESKDKYKPIKLGKSSKIRNGEFVIAMGSPLTLNNTNTMGIVSNKERSSDSLGLNKKHMNYIQTDAAITFGNSGGPLVNLDGEVIGINSMHVTAGISFAIPIDYAIDFLESYEKRDKTERRVKERKYIGITMLTINEKISEQLRRERHIALDSNEGVMIWRVIHNSPAYMAGLQPEDIIIELNGKPCKNTRCIYEALESIDDDPIELTIIRHTSRYKVRVTPQRA